MKRATKYLILLLLIFPNIVKANIELEEGLNILAFDLGGPSTENEYRENSSFGDSALIEQNGHYLLIDTGTNDNNDTLINYLKELKVKNLSIYLSHYHSDHSGKIKRILNDSYFNVENVYLPNSNVISSRLDESKEWYSTINAYVISAEKYKNDLINLGTNVVIINKDSIINIGDASLKVIWDITTSTISFDEIYQETPSSFKNRAINNTSLVSMITYKGIKFLTAGDIEKKAEEDILNQKINIKADIFKFSHHGATGSNMDEFIDKVNPSYAYFPNNYTAGKNNILWYGDRDNGKFRSFVNNLASKTNILSTLYNGNILYNISPKGEIKVKATRNYKTITVSYLDHNQNDLIEPIDYIFNDASVFHLDKINYQKEIKDYVLINTANNEDNYILENNIELKCYYEKLGDMNKDGTINFGDVIIALRKYLNIDATTEEDIKIGDMNNTKEIEFGDIISILRKYLNIN